MPYKRDSVSFSELKGNAAQGTHNYMLGCVFGKTPTCRSTYEGILK